MSRITKCSCNGCMYNDNNACTAEGVEIQHSEDNKDTAAGSCCNTFQAKKNQNV